MGSNDSKQQKTNKTAPVEKSFAQENSADELRKIQRKLIDEDEKVRAELVYAEVNKIRAFIDNGELLKFAQANPRTTKYIWTPAEKVDIGQVINKFEFYKGFNLIQSHSNIIIEWSESKPNPTQKLSSSSSSSSSSFSSSDD